MPRLARENTIASFGLALEHGAQAIELDVHATRDEVVVVHHDPRLADGTPITDISLAELRERDAKASEPVPTLRDVCAFVGLRAALFVEIKGERIERHVSDVLASYTGAAAIHSFDHDMIRRLATMGCPWPLGILVEEPLADPVNALRAAGASDLWPRWPLVDARMVDGVHAAGSRVIPWTVNDLVAARVLSDMGVDGICTDDVRLLASLSPSNARP